MNLNGSKKQLIVFFVGCCAIAGCADPNLPQYSQTLTPTPAAISASSTLGVQAWRTLVKGESLQNLTFTTDGKLLDQDRVLLAEIPVSYASNGDITYAQRLLVSDPSPSGRFSVIKACEGKNENEPGLCWAVFLVDRQAETAESVGIAKYGGLNWVQWSADERYAVFAESMEGVSWFVALDLQSKEAKMFEETPATADLSSFAWIDDRTFDVDLLCGDRAGCTELPFRGNISTLFNQ